MKDNIISKICSKCDIEKPVEEFYKCPRNKVTGRHAQCKQCTAEYNALNAEHNKERTRIWCEENAERKAAYVEAHREEHRIKASKYYWDNQDLVKQKAKVWRDANPELHKERSREYHKTHKKEVSEKAKKQYRIKRQDPVWYAARLEKNRKWRNENREHYNAYYREYYRKNKGKENDV